MSEPLQFWILDFYFLKHHIHLQHKGGDWWWNTIHCMSDAFKQEWIKNSWACVHSMEPESNMENVWTTMISFEFFLFLFDFFNLQCSIPIHLKRWICIEGSVWSLVWACLNVLTVFQRFLTVSNGFPYVKSALRDPAQLALLHFTIHVTHTWENTRKP